MKFSKIKDNDIANGIGITMSLWTQGCPHHCKGCFNGETWDFESGKVFTEDDLDYIMKNINKNSVQRDLSILGGEPLCPENVDGVIEVCEKFKAKFPSKKISMWTGYIVEDFTEKQKEVLKYLDVLVDGPFQQENRNLSLAMRGSSNQRVIDVKKSLTENKIVLFEV
ncbi:MAG: anaerobic ribonucleoside-triphosphate reductase activating protein [Intestinibacter bartlettii]